MHNALDAMIDHFRLGLKQLLEKMMVIERGEYLKNNSDTKGNGFYTRTIASKSGSIEGLQVPRTRNGVFKSELIPRRHSVNELEELVTELFIEGVSTRRIEGILNKCFNISLSHSSISNIAKAGEEEVKQWIERPLASHYACVFIVAFYFPLKRETSSKEAVYVAMSISEEGAREILGYWIPGGCEGASNWEEILRSLKQRGVKIIDFIISDGLTGIQDSISRVYPDANFQYCVLHAVRSSLNKVRAFEKDAVSKDLKKIYNSENKDLAIEAFDEFKVNWGKKYPKVIKFWKKHLNELLQFMLLPKELRQYVYTTNCVERNHKEIKRRLKAMEQFQNENSAEGILYLLYKRQNEKYLSGIKSWKKLYREYQMRQEVRSELQVI